MPESKVTEPENKLKTKRLPQRSCVGCRQVRDKRQLIRLVRMSNGGVEVDISGKKPGRGAYICPQFSCWQEGLKKDRLERALHACIPKDKRQLLIEYGRSLSHNKLSQGTAN